MSTAALIWAIATMAFSFGLFVGAAFATGGRTDSSILPLDEAEHAHLARYRAQRAARESEEID